MKRVILFDTSVGTMNQGDHIIMNSVERVLKPVLEQDSFAIKFPTHTPCFRLFQMTNHNTRYRFVRTADLKFLCGTNLIHNKILPLWPTWNIGLFSCGYAVNSVAIGVGSTGYSEMSLENGKISKYSSALYKKILSDQFVHSVRDDATAKVFHQLGKKAINTGCPTMWTLTEEFCSSIPTEKAPNVVFTLTDYNRKIDLDAKFIDGLKRSYRKLFFWPQGLSDLEYLRSITCMDEISVISPTLAAFSDVLDRASVDYIGTRLHAGIFAMQHKVRSFIISIDNRSADINQTNRINLISRNDVNNIEEICNQMIKTEVNIDTKPIQEWLSQFV